MIGYLTGIPKVEGEALLVVVGGVGYSVQVSNTVLSNASNTEHVSLYIYTHVREDALELYGFEHPEDKQLFLSLVGVSGVGPRTALTITGQGTQRVVTAVQQADVTFFKSVPRVGKKMAQKIIIELKNKLGGLEDIDLTPLSTKQQEIVAALEALGFDRDEAEERVKHTPDIENMSTQEIIKQALKNTHT
ncbi:MAG: Holliday junction branch migration protein RuvA [Pseudomonadales bacterium]|nr:Holliday junction branch migration protein RuvA [Candidatus Woesebacteria bacterium]MCB9802170.1 Holliday junction branch migration protein RuvA [Pseudomonadales bacterium]